MIDGVLYGSNGIGLVEAFHPGTGKTIWIQQPFADEPDRGLRGNSTRAVAYWTDGTERRLFAIRVNISSRSTCARASCHDVGRRRTSEPEARSRSTRHRLSVEQRPTSLWRRRHGGRGDDRTPPQTKVQPPGDVQAFDVHSGKPRWTFHVIPQAGEAGNETWEKDSWAYSGNANLWSLISADEELGLAYFPLTSPTNDMYGGHRSATICSATASCA